MIYGREVAQRSFLAACANVVAALLSFALVCVALGCLLPFPDVPVVRTKFAHLATHPGEYDTLFLGSSHVYYQIIPSVFDEWTARDGRPTHAFNAGIAGLRPPEDGYVLDRILELQGKKLRYVFIELAILRTRLAYERTRRAVYWHDWPRMSLIWRATIAQLRGKSGRVSVNDLRGPLGDLLAHLLLFVRRETNVGRGEIFASRWNGPVSDETPKSAMGANLDGWLPTNLPQIMKGEQLARYEEELAERRRQPARKHFGDAISQEAAERMISAVEKVGAVPVLIIPPTTDRKNFLPRRGRFDPIVLDFCSVEKFPELYEPGRRLDESHLNTAGAQLFTRLLAQEFLKETSSRR
jgi:hypothetical protein